MAGLGAGLETGVGAGLTPEQLSRQQFRTLTWLRWRIFVNTLRGKGAAGELIAKILSYPLLALMVFGPSVGAGFASYYLFSGGMEKYLALLLWVIFAVWQFVGVSTSASGPTFDLSSLTRFPMRYRDYFLIRLSFGLMDPPNLVGLGCLGGVAMGAVIAAPSLSPWAAFVLALYAVANLLFSRMIYSWIERWLAQRKTRELITVVILLASLGFQVVAQSMHRLSHHGRHSGFSPQTLHFVHILYVINWFLPPGLASKSIEFMNGGSVLFAGATVGGLAVYIAIFLLTLNKRLHAQFLGENLSEAPAAGVRPKKNRADKTARTGGRETVGAGSGLTLISPTVTALLIKEFRYLVRSGPKLYSLIVPVFMVFIFSSRNSGMAFIGMGHGGREAFVFSYGCLYLQLLLVAMLYNSLGGDTAGIQFYFMAPLRFRDVMLAKNLLTFGIFLVEVALIYLAASTLSQPPSLDLAAATVAGSFFIFFVNMSIGNVRSLVSPKFVDPTKVRRQNISGLNGLISLLVTMGGGAIGALALAGSEVFWGNYWVATLVLLVLAGAAVMVYLAVYRSLDSIALQNQESIASELCKS